MTDPQPSFEYATGPWRGQCPEEDRSALGLLVLKAGVEREPDAICDETVQLIRERIRPVAVFKQAVVVERLPKTRSGKILRGTMRRIADAEPYTTPATIDDPDREDRAVGR